MGGTFFFLQSWNEKTKDTLLTEFVQVMGLCISFSLSTLNFFKEIKTLMLLASEAPLERGLLLS